MINVDTRKLYHILDHTPATHNIMLVGRHGIGKSEILTDYFVERGMRVVSLFLGQMADPGDLIGLPFLSSGNTSSFTFAPPYWWPLDNEPIVLFLDELNRARPEILQTVMDLALNRRLAGRQLPAGSRIISAVNEGDEYQLTLLDPALVSRFNIYQFCPTAQEWLLWAQKSQLDQRIIDFIASQPTLLDGTPSLHESADTGLEKYPDRRAWQRASDVLQETAPDGKTRARQELSDDDLDLLAGIVGAEAASRFYAFVQGRQMLTGSQVLNDCDACEEKLRSYRLHQLAIVNESIFRQFEIEGIAGTPEETDELSKEQIQRYAQNFEKYYSLLESMEQREAIAHLANLFQSGSYQQAVLFVVTYCPDIYGKLAEFIAQL